MLTSVTGWDELPEGRQERDLRHAARRGVPESNFQKCPQEVPNAIL